MLTAEQIRQIERRLHEAKFGDMQERVNARQSYAADVEALLSAIKELGIDVFAARVLELERKIEAMKVAEEVEKERPPLPSWVKPEQMPLRLTADKMHDGKMAAVGKDA